MELSDPAPTLFSILAVLTVGLALLLLASWLRRFPSGPGRFLGRLVLAFTVSWYAVFGLSLLYPHQHHRIWSAALSYSSNYWINAALGTVWLIGSYAIWRRLRGMGIEDQPVVECPAEDPVSTKEG